MFPILFLIAKRSSILILVVLFLFHMTPILIENVIIELLKTYILVFSLGIVYALNNKIISRYLEKINFFILVPILILVFVFFSYLKLRHAIPGLYGMKVDPFLTMTMILISITLLRSIPYFNEAMQYLGKHSMNIYMVHSFIYYYYYGKFIYSFEYPILIFIALILLSLIVSITFEFIKKIIHFSSLVKHVSNLV